MSTLGDRIAEVRGRIAQAARRAGRDPGEVTLVAVTKTVPEPQIRKAYEAGLRTFGENRVQEGVSKIAQLSQEMPGVSWHLVGHLQTNKVKPAVEAFSVIESVDSERLLAQIDRRAAVLRPGIPVLLEVNVAGEASKSGFNSDDLLTAFPRLAQLPAVRIQGLMTVAPLTADMEDVRPVFRALRGLRDEICKRYAVDGFGELSMGMTNDFEVAIEEGATIVRVGRAIFGERPR